MFSFKLVNRNFEVYPIMKKNSMSTNLPKFFRTVSDKLSGPTRSLGNIIGYSGIPILDERAKYGMDVKQGQVDMKAIYGMKPYYEIAARLVKERLINAIKHYQSDGKELITLNTLATIDTVVITDPDQHDSVETILTWAGVPFIEISKSEVPTFPFSPHQTVIVNCAETMYSSESFSKFRQFVKDGGQLITSDYGLTSILSNTWPEIINISDQVFDRTPHENFHLFISLSKQCADQRIIDTFQGEPDSSVTWCIKKKSDIVKVVDNDKVNQLMASSTDKTKGILYHFFFGHGQVYHLVPHFVVTTSNSDPLYMRNLVAVQDYIKQKGGSKKLLKVAEGIAGEHGNSVMDLPTLRSTVTSMEFLLRIIFKQRQVTKGPILRIPPNWE